jgi:hypothetical protein
MTVDDTARQHERSQRAITAHFAGRAAAADEAAMRAHLPACASCRRVYERHLLLARLDPTAAPPEARLARGLDLRPRTAARFPAWSAALAASAAALCLWYVARAPTEAGFTARGSEERGDVRTPAFWIYRVTGETPELARSRVAASDELAFAYANPTGLPYVMIFGVDEHEHVYWFHPAWPRGSAAPAAVGAQRGTGPHELPGAVRHAFDGQRLVVYAVFSPRSLTASAAEDWVQRGTTTTSLAPGVATVQHALQVSP